MTTTTTNSGHLTPANLMSLERYARERGTFRERVLAHKAIRNVTVGPHMTWLFEDRLTIQYQVQEILRTERIFEFDAIVEELAAYNPLIPDGTNFKVTLLIEYTDVSERQVALAQLKGVEQRCWVQVGDERVYAIADEDLERENDVKTSAVHFLRFELTDTARAAVRGGAPLTLGADHAAYSASVTVTEATRQALALDVS